MTLAKAPGRDGRPSGARLVFVGSAATCAGVTAGLAPETVEHLDQHVAAVEVRGGHVGVLIVELDGAHDRLAAELAVLRVEAIQRPLPVLALVRRDDTELMVEAFEHGVADVAGLPLVAGELRARVRLLVRRAGVARHLRERARIARQLAMTDPVTQLFNRQYFDQAMVHAVAQARAAAAPLTLLMIDVDSLKPVNDRHGHAAGDRMLAAVAARLLSNLGDHDVVARYGGDEIAVAMPGSDVETATQVAHRLCAAVAEHVVDGIVAPVTVSIGVAGLDDADADAAALLARADAALYAGKRGGRNRVEVA